MRFANECRLTEGTKMESMTFWEEMLARVSGPMKLRLFMQPLMAMLFAFRDGRKDAQAGRLPYLFSMINHPEHRRELLRSGWKSVGKVFIIASLLDVVYQYKVAHSIRLIEGLVVAALLALIPYLLVRGPVNRLMSRGGNVKPTSQQ